MMVIIDLGWDHQWVLATEQQFYKGQDIGLLSKYLQQNIC